MSMNLNNLHDAEEFQKHFVSPMVDAVRAEIKPLVDRVSAHEDRIRKMEESRKKALVGYGVAAFICSMVGGLGLAKAKMWLSAKFGL